MNAIADKFGVSESTVPVAIRRVLDFLLSISEREIRWPNDEEAARNKRAFRALGRCDGVEASLPDVIGAIDGCHVRITRPTVCEEDYYNRKKFHSIILPDVCDADMVFTDVFVGFPGRAHDARVLEESFLFEEAASRYDDSDIVNSDLGIFSSEPVDVDHKPTLAARLRDRLAQSVPL
nr:putative nuclease HARBI1 [Rhipicephalus microplus]